MTMAEQTNIMFPDITNVTFWSHVYRKVALDPNDMNTIMVSPFFFFEDILIVTFFSEFSSVDH